MRTRLRWACAVPVAAWVLVAAPSLKAQAALSVDLGVSRVDYDGFLPSAAVAFTPAVTFERQHSSVNLRGTYLVFQSGNRSIQGSVMGSGFRRVGHTWRVELWGMGGGSRYADFASFWHALAGARAYRPAGRAIVWADITGGATSYGRAARPVAVAGAGVWGARAGLELGLSVSHARVGDTTYTDFRAEGRRGVWKGVIVQGELGARVWSRGAGRGVYGEGAATIPLGTRLSLVLAGGRYPTDPARGSISGRYLSAAVRVTARARPGRDQPNAAGRLPAALSPAAGTASGTHSTSVDPKAGPWLAARTEASGAVRLRVHARQAHSVELAGDFTDWMPVRLAPIGDGTWEVTLVVAPGVHRVNVRVEGGRWIVPRGTTAVPDDFGSEIGLLIVR